MFTGIIEEIGIVRSLQRDTITTRASKVLEDTKVGDSIAVNGVCLTVVSLDNSSFQVNVMPETLKRTNLGKLNPGDKVNLERALMLGGRLGGHLVQGHVDATGQVVSFFPQEKALIVRYSAPAELMRYIVPKGFIAVDGVSLTVVEANASSFTVSLVEITQKTTNLVDRRPGDPVNLEVDIIAKYVEKMMETRRAGISEEFLLEHGFIK
jgi:riboflavin synthase